MMNVPVQEKYVNVLTAFGNIQAAIDTAVRRYTLKQITAKITELRQQDKAYQAKYEMAYPIRVQVR